MLAQIDRILLLKNIPHETVNVTYVANILPRPKISDLLGVTYWKILVLAMGNEVYCDTRRQCLRWTRRFFLRHHWTQMTGLEVHVCPIYCISDSQTRVGTVHLR
ncbi:hypothetical protein C8F04DRAFT_1113006 [Mycena alexandri]|uniref:Uncharacterized protein n=1 Tax=Mycena alexandri TaxID=1745969 RepID=A0AAD6SRP3_9AGAR|nr:hypothetical protein C8F04DRAFT_1113006 [Mycena alexandri]